MKFNWSGISSSTWVRLAAIVCVSLWIAAAAAQIGTTEAYVAAAASIVAVANATWKNNDLTLPAQEASSWMRELKDAGKTDED